MMSYDQQKILLGKLKVQANTDVGICMEMGASAIELPNIYNMISANLRDAEAMLYALDELKKSLGVSK